MLKKEVLELLKEIEDDAEIDSLLQSTDLFKSASDKKLTIEEFRELINNDANFKAIIDNEKNKYLILSKKGVEVFNIHKEQQEHIEKAIFSILRNYSEEDLQMVMKLLDDVEQVWRELPWKKSR